MFLFPDGLKSRCDGGHICPSQSCSFEAVLGYSDDQFIAYWCFYTFANSYFEVFFNLTIGNFYTFLNSCVQTKKQEIK